MTVIIGDLKKSADAGERFGTIYADPPWDYDNQSTRAATGNHYGTMCINDIAAMPISQLTLDKCHLHMWTTNAFLFECPKIFEAWGFEFKSSFIWTKKSIGIGNYWRNSHEILLTGVRGGLVFKDHSLRSWIECDRGEHSSKPEQIRSMIERASPGPYLELFARRPIAGWSVWGNQISPDLFTQDIPVSYQ